MANVFEIVTDKIVAALTKGKIPWEKPWEIVGHKNLSSGKLYRGINQFLLSSREGESSHLWVTYNQAQTLGGQVRKGERGTLVVFWTFIPVKGAKEEGDKIDAKTKKNVRPILRYYTVFDAVHQCDGLEAKVKAATGDKVEFVPIDKAQSIIDLWADKPPITHGGNRAYYRPSEDSINLPPREQFNAAEGYYATAFHELVHSTGHKNRLDRKGVNASGTVFGSEVYSQEELVAEFGAAFLCAESGIERTIENHTAYIQGWLKALKSDTRLAVFAASQAQKAADLILSGAGEEDEAGE